MKSGKSKFDINLICLVASQFTILVIYLKLIMIALYSFSWLPLLLDKYFAHIFFFCLRLHVTFREQLESPELKLSGPNKLGRIDYFKHLRNAKFCLAPRGESSWTLRFYESFFVVSSPLLLLKEGFM